MPPSSQRPRDETDGSSGNSPAGRITLYVIATAAAAAAVFVATAQLGGPLDFRPAWLLVAAIAMLCVSAGTAARVRARGEEGLTRVSEEAVLVFLALQVAPFAALTAVVAGVVLGEALLRRSPLKAVFNVAQVTASSGVALLVMVGLRSSGEPDARTVLALLAGMALFFIVSNGAFWGVISVAGRARFRDVAAEDLVPAALFWTGNVAVGVLAGLAAAAQEWTLPFALPAMGALSLALGGHMRARQERQKLADLVASSSNAIFSVDGSGTIKSWNPTMERIAGVPARSALDRPLTDTVLLHHADGSPVEDVLDASAVIKSRVVRMTAHPSDERWLMLGRASLPDGGFVFDAQDLTGQRATERALAHAERRYRRLVEQLPLAVYIDTPEQIGRRLRWTNVYLGPQIESMLGYSRTTWRGDPELFAKILHPDDRGRVLSEIARARKDGVGHRSEYRLIADDGRIVWIHDESVYVRDTDGRLEAVEGYLIDVTERKMLEQQFLQAQKMEALGTLAGGIAHDFNNLLSAVIGFGGLALSGLGADDPVRADIEQVVRAGERATTLTRQLLALSRRQVLEPSVVDLNEVVLELAPLLRRLLGEDVQLVSSLPPDLARVYVDAAQMEQVIINLAVNARDAMPGGGTLTIETANVRLDEEYAATHLNAEPGDHVLLAVSDTGVGMDAALRDQIFEPFFTTKEEGKGTGLGLSTVFGIVKQSGGNIAVYSEPREGTTFKVYLPPVRLERDAEEAVAPSPGHQRGSETILVVEDDPFVRALERDVLERMGYAVLDADLPSRAIEIVEGHDGPIHLVITDVVMPELNGPALAQRVLDLRPGIRVLYTSGYPDEAMMQRGALDPDAAFLAKPLTSQALTQKVRELLDDPIPVTSAR